MTKRYGTPRMKDGELKIQYGKLPHENPDLIICRGEGVARADGHLVFNMIDSSRPSYKGTIRPSILEELEARGYDITTLRFSVCKKKKLT